MLSKENRLRKKKEFNFIYKKGEIYYSKFFAMYVCKTKFNFAKIGFSVSNKVGNSIIRHKVKRKISEAVRLNIKLFKPNNYIFVAKKGSELLDFNEVEQNLFYLLKKAKINE